MSDRKFAVVGALVFFARAARHIATLAYVRRRYPKSSSAVAGAAGMFAALAALGSYAPSPSAHEAEFQRAVDALVEESGLRDRSGATSSLSLTTAGCVPEVPRD